MLTPFTGQEIHPVKCQTTLLPSSILHAATGVQAVTWDWSQGGSVQTRGKLCPWQIHRLDSQHRSLWPQGPCWRCCNLEGWSLKLKLNFIQIIELTVVGLSYPLWGLTQLGNPTAPGFLNFMQLNAYILELLSFNSAMAIQWPAMGVFFHEQWVKLRAAHRKAPAKWLNVNIKRKVAALLTQ